MPFAPHGATCHSSWMLVHPNGLSQQASFQTYSEEERVWVQL